MPSNLLKDKYGWPPFSILNTISWDWQRRKDEWEVLFKDSTEGRDVKRYNATPTNTFSARGADVKKAESISEFDPYLCELMYRWFSNKGDKILDPFAGGCVRGVVSSVLGRDYYGVDLSLEQIDANYIALNNIRDRYTQDDAGDIMWRRGDSEEILKNLSPKFDMVLTCPPYYNLEKYSNDPKDLSNLSTYEKFLHKYTIILEHSARLLKENSFFVIVVSEIRADSQSIANSQYLGFVPDTIRILRDVCNLKYYNEIILENAIGSLPIRAPKYFVQSRKIGRHHQNILVFYKGDIENIADKFGENF
jgi:DNA modification methylase